MSRKTKLWLIMGGVLVLVGGLLFVGVMTHCHWDFTKLSTVTYTESVYELREPFYDISINSTTADVLILPSTDGKCKVICREEEERKHTVTVKDNTLVIERDLPKKLQIQIFDIGTTEIVVYLPLKDYGNVTAKVTTGDVEVESLTAKKVVLSASTGDITASSLACEGEMRATVTTGKVYMTDVTAETFHSYGSTGKVFLTHVVVENKMELIRSTGDMILEGSDAGELNISVTTGDVKGTLLSSKVFDVEAGSGDVRIPKSDPKGGPCRIHTTTGEVEIEIE